MQEEIITNKNESTGLTIRDMFYKYIRFLPWFIFSVAVALLAAFLYLRYTVPVYSVGGTMVIKNEQTQTRGDGFDELFGNNQALNIQSEIEVLRSSPLMARVVDSLDLQFSYSAIGKIKSMNVYRAIPFRVEALEVKNPDRGFDLDVNFIDLNRFTVNGDLKGEIGKSFSTGNGVFRIVGKGNTGTNYEIQWRSTASRASQYASSIGVSPKVTGTGILNVTMRSTNAQMAADIVNMLMQEYSAYTIEQKNRTSDQTLQFVNDRLLELGQKLDSAQRVLLSFMQRNDLIDANAQSSNYFALIGESDKALNEQTLQVNVTDMINEYLRDRTKQFSEIPVVPSSLGLTDVTLNELVSQYNLAQLARKQMLDANIPQANPQVVEATQKIEQLRSSIIENLKNIRTSFSTSISALRSKSINSKAELRTLPVKVKEQMELQRQVDVLQNLYNLLINEGEKTAISKSANVSNSDIINRAFPNTTPVKPKRRSIQIMAVLIGLAIPALFIFLGEVLNDKVTTRADIEKLTSAPVLGEIGHSFSENVLIVNKTTRSMVAEQFRIVRSNLQYVLNKKEKAVILATSSFSGEGKSFVSTNLAAVLALAGKRTIVLEFDIRKPKILSGLGIPKGQGITNYLLGKATLEEVIQPVKDHENLFVLGCGPVPPNPSELLLDPRVEEMFTWLRANFDMVIVDTAPVGMVSDAMTLGRFADCTMYLVRQGHTFKKQIALIDDFYHSAKLPRISIIINDVKLKPGYGYYGYGRYGYGYGYGYGSYYEEEQQPLNRFERFVSWLDFRKWFKKKKNR